MTTTEAQPESVAEWMTAKEAARILGVNQKRVPRLAAARLLTVRRIAGSHARYYRPDVEHLARRSTVMAEPQCIE